jgi:leucyl aminopeptidase
MVALGNDTAGLFTNDDNLKDEVIMASKDAFEPVWHLPINDEHKETIKGDYGDICNNGKSRYGGASSAAAFLLRFV